MARPMTFDRDAAIAKAMHLIWRDGYEASSVKSVAEALGITRSSYYNTFGSRDALFVEALHHYLTVIPEAVLFTDAAEHEFPRLLTALLREICVFRTQGTYRGLGCLAANSLAELLPSDGEAAEALAALTRQILARLQALIEAAVARGELPDETDPPALALSIQGLIIGLNMQSKVITDADQLWRSAAQTLRGLGLYQE